MSMDARQAVFDAGRATSSAISLHFSARYTQTALTLGAVYLAVGLAWAFRSSAGLPPAHACHNSETLLAEVRSGSGLSGH